MTVAIMQPYSFPYLGYYQLIQAVDKFIIYDDVNFINRGWVNRNNILVNDKPFLFTVPLKNASQNKLINEIDVMEEIAWKKKFLKTIEQSYGKTAQFKKVFLLISEIINTPFKKIHELALTSIEKVSEYLSIPTHIIRSTVDYGNQNLKGQERILDICKREQADRYINPIGGIEIYSLQMFDERGIRLNFLKTNTIRYHQFNNEFVPNLSIIDVLMFNSPKEITDLLKQYKLT